MIRSIAAASLLFVSTSALAADADDVADARCILVAGEMADTKDKEAEEAGSVMLFYYLGRIDGRNPRADVGKLIAQAAERLSEKEKEQVLAACAAQVETRGNQLGGG